MTGNIFNIQRFSTNDGPGIRTVIFLKGCPLSCIWCHNPESKKTATEIFFNPEKCLNCRLCENVCPNNAHIFENNVHIYNRKSCGMCMKCVDVCVMQALERCGKAYETDEVIREALKDKEFYEQSGGGVTLSGGEPLFQYGFSVEILKKLKEKDIHTAIETSGYCNADLSEISRYVDLWLYDIKLISEDEHIKHTGVSNKIIIRNLHFLDSIGAKIILRCPIISDVNMKAEHFERIKKLANSLKNIVAVHFEPYHPLGLDKAKNLGKEQAYKNSELLTHSRLLPFIENLKSEVKVPVMII